MSIGLDPQSIDRLMPLHLVTALDGTIQRVGPTLAKLFPESEVVGTQFTDHFDIRLPREVSSIADLVELSEKPLRLTLRNKDRTRLKGLAAPLEGGGAVLIDMSFGISVVEAVRQFGLTSSDFGETDLGIELLFLAEAQQAALGETQRFSRRLEVALATAQEAAATDTLTGARNRRALDQLLCDLAEAGQPFGVIHLDVDGFKAVNELCGHPGGDAILREISKGVQECVRPEDLVARTGGDEFILVLPGVGHPKAAEDVARRILDRLELPLVVADRSVRISVSLGLAVSRRGQTRDTRSVLREADAALFSAKRSGGGRFAFNVPGGEDSPSPQSVSEGAPPPRMD